VIVSLARVQPKQEAIRVWRAPDVDGVELHRGIRVTRVVPPHWHEEYQLCLIEQGAGELICGAARLGTPPWSLFVVHPGEVHSNRPTVDEGCTFRTMDVHPDLLRRAACDVSGRERGLPSFPSPVFLEATLLRRFLLAHALLERPAARLERDAALVSLLALLVERHAEEPIPPSLAEPDRRAPARVRDYLESHCAEEVRLADLARLAGLSPSHLNRVFRRAYGLAPHAYQIQARISRARGLLRAGLSPAQVAARTGFADQSHFHRRFKTVVGVTPGAYAGPRKNVQDPGSPRT
jgi:AraC-like DNA-binding protein